MKDPIFNGIFISPITSLRILSKALITMVLGLRYDGFMGSFIKVDLDIIFKDDKLSTRTLATW